nr:replication protein A 70 kDa DNA-binding subunit-like [Ipomoea batatas]
MHRDRSIRVRLVRTYEVPEVRGGQASKSKELLFHDVEGSSIHANIVRDDVVKYRDVFCEGKTEVKQIKSKGFPILMICLKSFQSLNDPTKVNENELYGEVRITSSYDATKLHCNASFAEFLEFKSKLMSGQSPVRSISIATVLSQSLGIGDFTSDSKVVTSISDMLDQKENGDFYVPAEILGMEGSSDWYYISYMSLGCNKKLKE